MGLAAAAVFVAAVVFFGLMKRRPVEENYARPLNERFTVQNRSGSRVGGYATLEDALERVPAEGVVELRWNGPREMPAMTLPRKALTLRAAPGFEPEWNSADPSRSALTASASLTLEGIRFVASLGEMEEPGGARPAGRPGFRPYAARVAPSGAQSLR